MKMGGKNSSEKKIFFLDEKKSKFVSLCQYTPGKRTNILVFGPEKSGKSSVIVALSTHDSKKSVLILKQNHEIEPTKEFTSYPLNGDVELFDTWGWRMKRNFRKDEFESMLDGKMKMGSKPKDIVVTVPMKDREIDIVLFVVEAEDILKEENQRKLEELQRFVDLARKKEKGVMFIASKIDKVVIENEDEEKIYPRKLFESKRSVIEEVVKKAETRFQCEGHVFPMTRYTVNPKRNKLIRCMKCPIIEAINEFQSKQKQSDCNLQCVSKKGKVDEEEEQKAIDELLAFNFGEEDGDEKSKEKKEEEKPTSSLDENSKIFSVILKDYNPSPVDGEEEEEEGEEDKSDRVDILSRRRNSKKIPKSLTEENAIEELLAMSNLMEMPDDADGSPSSLPSTIEEMAEFCKIIRSPGGSIVNITCSATGKKE